MEQQEKVPLRKKLRDLLGSSKNVSDVWFFLLLEVFAGYVPFNQRASPTFYKYTSALDHNRIAPWTQLWNEMSFKSNLLKVFDKDNVKYLECLNIWVEILMKVF